MHHNFERFFYLAKLLVEGVESFGMLEESIKEFRLRSASKELLYKLFCDTRMKAEKYFAKFLKDWKLIDFILLDPYGKI